MKKVHMPINKSNFRIFLIKHLYNYNLCDRYLEWANFCFLKMHYINIHGIVFSKVLLLAKINLVVSEIILFRKTYLT